MKKLSFILLASIAFLSISCTSDTDEKEKFVISAPSLNYSAISDMKKDVKLSSNRDNVTFKFLNPNLDTSSFLDINGELTFRTTADIGEIESLTIIGVLENGEKSSPITLNFTTLSNESVNTIKVLKTGADDGGFGEDRSFNVNGDGDVVDLFGNIWAVKSDKKALEVKTYANANYKCKSINPNENWRIPTTNEVLNLLNYSKSIGTSLLEEPFLENELIFTWVQEIDKKTMILALNSGIVAQIDSYARVREYTTMCINAPLEDENHIVSTDRTTGYTHDLSTALQWSSIDEQKSGLEAAEYCNTYKAESGWRLPNINELRSIIEKNSVSNFLRNGTTVMFSSTPYNNVSDVKANYVMYLAEDGTISFGAQPVTENYGITCVKNRD